MSDKDIYERIGEALLEIALFLSVTVIIIAFISVLYQCVMALFLFGYIPLLGAGFTNEPIILLPETLTIFSYGILVALFAGICFVFALISAFLSNTIEEGSPDE